MGASPPKTSKAMCWEVGVFAGVGEGSGAWGKAQRGRTLQGAWRGWEGQPEGRSVRRVRKEGTGGCRCPPPRLCSSALRSMGARFCPLAFCPPAATKLGGICFALSEESPPSGIWSADPHTHSLEHHGKCLLLTPALAQPPGAPWAQWPRHTPPHRMKRPFTWFQSYLSFTELDERGEGGTRG